MWKRYLVTNSDYLWLAAGEVLSRRFRPATRTRVTRARTQHEMTSRKTVAVFMGTRPEAIKMAPVVAALRAAADLDCRVVATGQHREMFQQVADQFGFRVDADLAAMQPHQTLAGLTARLMERIDAWLAERPSRHGAGAGRHDDRARARPSPASTGGFRSDTSRRGCGPATSGRRSPRRSTAGWRPPIVSVHFAPTESAKAALLREGIPESGIEVTGNTVIDALLMELARQEEPADSGGDRRGARPRCWARTGPRSRSS